MDRNPYAPPSAEVADPAPQAPDTRPASVTTAVRIFWAIVVATVIGGVAYRSRVPGTMPLWVFIVLALALITAVNGFFIVKIARGRNWARIVYLAILIMGYANYAFDWKRNVEMMQASRVYAVVTIACALANVWAFTLLFLPAANAWFRRSVRVVR